MINSTKQTTIKINSRLDKLFILCLFAILMSYISIRLFTVFYVHDEIVSIWAYMIDWNPIPYQGYFDANNQFLNSLLGGLFIRLFQSDAIWVTRLPNVLSFPLYYFSVVAFYRFFTQKAAFYFFLISLTFTPFILDFFSLARGYGLAWAFLMWAICQGAIYIKERNSLSLIYFLLASLLTLYSNLSLLPLIIINYCFLLFFKLTLKERVKNKIEQLIYFLIAIVFLGIAIDYALELQSSGKLYLGAANDFYSTTVEPLIGYLWGTPKIFTLVVLSSLSLGVLISLISLQKKLLSLFSIPAYFSILLLLSLAFIFMLNIFVGVNFPENRSAVYLIFLFYGSIAFTLDQIRWKGISIAFSSFTLVLFVYKANFTHAMVYKSEHYDIELLSKIPDRINGIPPSTAGVYYNQDNAISRIHHLPIRALQSIVAEPTIMQDYLIEFADKDSLFNKDYQIIHIDPISNLALFERKQFLERTKLFEQNTQIDGDDEFVNLMDNRPSQAGFVRCKGTLKNMTLQNQAVILFTQENTANGEKLSYGGIAPVTSAAMDKNGTIVFDFTYTMMGFEEADQMSVYIYNKQKHPLKGEISIFFYGVDPIRK